MHEYLLLLPIGKLHMNDLFIKDEPLPLHCTLMHWFSLGRDLPLTSLDTYLEDLAGGVGAPVELVSREPALFGPENKTPVHILEQNHRLMELHAHLFRFLDKLGCVPKAPQWIGEGYRPHVSTVEGRAFAPGMRYKAQQLALIGRKSEDKSKTVKAIYRFGSTYSAAG
jgi:hypothetical protein